MPSGIAYKPIKTWSAAQTASELACLAPHQKLLLLSDGSLTRELEILTDGKVRAEVISTGTFEMSGQDANYLDTEPGCKALKRTVWLVASGKRLVYAHTVIPLKSVDADILKAIEKTPEEPLGRVFLEKGIFFTKDKLEFAVIRCPDAAKGLGLTKDAPLFARRCVLSNRPAKDRVRLRAAVIEVFSPEIVPCGPSRMET